MNSSFPHCKTDLLAKPVSSYSTHLCFPEEIYLFYYHYVNNSDAVHFLSGQCTGNTNKLKYTITGSFKKPQCAKLIKHTKDHIKIINICHNAGNPQTTKRPFYNSLHNEMTSDINIILVMIVQGQQNQAIYLHCLIALPVQYFKVFEADKTVQLYVH